MQLWVDVEDLFVHAAESGRRMSGIQRFEAELCRALRAEAEAGALSEVSAVRFLRHETFRLAFYEVSWAELVTLFGRLSAEPKATPPSQPPAPALAVVEAAPAPAIAEEAAPAPEPVVLLPAFRQSMPRRVASQVPPSIRHPIAAALRSQRQALRETVSAARAVARAMFPRRLSSVAAVAAAPPPTDAMEQPEASPPKVEVATQAVAVVTAPARPPEPSSGIVAGDVLLTAGAAWIFPRYAARVAALRRRGVRFTLLVHDIIPLRRPEWCHPGHTHTFREWLEVTLPQCDALLTVSKASASEITSYAGASGLDLPHVPVVVPMGGGFQPPVGLTSAETSHLPPPGSYVMFVSTIEARKNQAFLVRVWRQLLDEMPREKVPTLVFVGHIGGMVDDMFQELRNSGFMAGAVQLIQDPSDAELVMLYRGCRFTLFPSLYEGWGLPVAESMAFGKPCLASDATSIPEVGGSLARYFDPLNVRSAVRAIRALIDDPADLLAWEARVVREHRPTPWADTAHAIVAASLERAFRPLVSDVAN